MSTIDNLYPQGGQNGAQGSLLPALRQGADIVTRIRQDLEKIDSLMSSITQKTQGANFGGSGGGGVHSNGMPQARFSIPGRQGGGLARDVWDSYAVAGELPAGGSGAIGGGGAGGGTHSNGMPVPVFGGSGGGGRGSGGSGFVPSVLKDFGMSVGQQWWGANISKANQAYSNDLLFNYMRSDLGGGMGAQRNGIPTALVKGYGSGSFGYQDVLAGSWNLYNAGVSPGVMSNSAFASSLSSLSNVTGMGMAGTSQMVSSMLGNSRGLFMGRAVGVPMVDNNGNPVSFDKTLNGIFRATNTNNVDAALTNFGSLSQNLKGFLGIDQAQVEALRPIFEAAQKNGGNIDFSSASFKQALKGVGGGANLLSTYQKNKGDANAILGALQNNATATGVAAADTASGHLAKGFDDLYNAMKPVSDLFTGMARGVGALGSNGPGGGQNMFGGAVNSMFNAALNGMVLKQIFGGGAGAAKSIPALDLRTGMAQDAVDATMLSRAGSFARSKFARSMGWGAVATGTSALTDYATSHLTHNGHQTLGSHLAHTAGTVGTYAAMGASVGALGLPIPVVGEVTTGVGAAVGGVAGLGKSLFDWFGGGGGNGHGATNNANTGSLPGVSSGGILGFAQTLIGTPYSWGGGGVGGASRGINQGASTVGFDCSSFVQYVFAHYGVQLPRTTYEQVKCGQAVSAQNAAPGDLFFFGSASAPDHVAIYMGNGKIIEAPHTGASIRISPCSPSAASIIKRVTNNAGYAASTSSTQGTVVGGGSSLLADVINQARQGANGMGMDLAAYQFGGGGIASALAGGGGSSTSTSVPAPGGSKTFQSLVQLASGAGFDAKTAPIMAAIALAESGGNSNSHNTNASTGDNSYGLWQINMLGAMGPSRAKEFGIGNYDQLFAPSTNAHAAFDIWRDQGLNAWSTYKSGAYKKYLPGYDKGAWDVKGDQLAVVHDGEMVVPKGPASALRAGHSGGGSAKQVVIQVNASGYTQTEAVRLANMVKDILQHDHDLASIGAN